MSGYGSGGYTPGGYHPRRRRRVGLRLLAVVVALAVFGGVGFGVYWYTFRTKTTTVGTPRCTATPTVTTVIRPVAASRVTVNVYNATNRRGLAAAVAAALRSRGFVVASVANDPLNKTIAGAAEVRSGTLGLGAALTVGSEIKGATRVTDSRGDATVDLVLGNGYSKLNTPAQALAALRSAVVRTVKATPHGTPVKTPVKAPATGRATPPKSTKPAPRPSTSC